MAKVRGDAAAVCVSPLDDTIGLRCIQTTIGAHGGKVPAAAAANDVGERRGRSGKVNLGDDPVVAVAVEEQRARVGGNGQTIDERTASTECRSAGSCRIRPGYFDHSSKSPRRSVQSAIRPECEPT